MKKCEFYVGQRCGTSDCPLVAHFVCPDDGLPDDFSCDMCFANNGCEDCAFCTPGVGCTV